MDDSRCIHQLHLCDQCGGLQTTTLVELDGVTAAMTMTADDGEARPLAPGTRLFWTAGPDPCEPPAAP